ncbi:MAG: rhomboid family intramembrane serine protease, partial [Planctomycetota bacterium]|nr:rhomboid family intramembrane serine protease [Planctomycetota bacterium]
MLRRIEPVTAILVLLCVGWTLICRAKELTYAEAGALQEQLLWEGEYHRILTAAFLHDLGGWLHIVGNAIGLLFVGTIVARECGRGVYLWILFLSVCGGWAAGMLWYEAEMWQMGISGGVYGLIGLLFA